MPTTHSGHPYVNYDKQPKLPISHGSKNEGSRLRASSRVSNEEEQGAYLSVFHAIEQPRLVIDNVAPCVDEGRYPAKGVIGQKVTVTATIFCDGHNRLAARVIWKEATETHWHSRPLELLGNDFWCTSFVPQKTGKHYYRLEAWLDRWQNYHHELYEKSHAGVPVGLEVREGRLLLRDIFTYASNQDRLPEEEGELTGPRTISHSEMPRGTAKRYMEVALKELDDAHSEGNLSAQVRLLLDSTLAEAVKVLEPRQFLIQPPQTYIIDVERAAAGYSAWYELFPRSMSVSGGHGTFDDVITRLPEIQAMGFDVLYFPPIHPIGERNRKGPNNSVVASPGDLGSPYAIGSSEGGHETVYSALGGIESFRRLRKAATNHGLEIALDFAIQCSPDHPWLKEHPGWFSWRPDGTIRYAENPPKKYQDIVNVDFYAEQAKPDMWLAWRDIILYWISEGVSIFRVDNPHTKPLPFWEWLIADVRTKHPETIFLSEAFTQPAMMYTLAKVGFTQSYTYFTWRNNKRELTEYIEQLTTSDVKDYYRPNFFVNTPDINPYFLQTSGRPGFLIRAALASTLSGLWGVYSGFELCEADAIPGREEYLNSEKYEIRTRDFFAPGNIVSEIARLNRIRKENPALHTHLNTQFYHVTNDNVLYFGKASQDKQNFILVAISLDPHTGQDAQIDIPMEQFDVGEHASFDVVELMRNICFRWYGRRQHWFFDVNEIPFAIWRLQPRSV